MLSTTTALPTETSWGDTLKSYQAERGLASWDKLGEAHPPKDHRVTHYEKRSKFNPLLQRHYDPRRERSARNSAAEADGAKLAAAVDKQPPFDIVTHEFRSGKTPADRAPSNKPPDSRTSWNIINHEAKDPGRPAEVRRRRARNRAYCPLWKRREFDIVSNKYISDHKGRTLRDRTEAKHSAQKLFWETHDFDPLLGRYYDAGKEADFAKQRAVLSSIAGQGSVARLPPAVQYCEGAAYDILRDRSVKRDDRDKSRALARFAKTVDFCEREGGRHHGYDVLTHESHVGRLARPMATMRIKKPDGPWQQLSKSAAVVTADLSGRPLPATRPRRQGRAPGPQRRPGARAADGAGVEPHGQRPHAQQAQRPRRPRAHGRRGAAPAPSVPALKLPTSPA
ncbi:hypothetical protein JL722_12783 [Aureococcus anophagefferens]|nr:hypothetical protein JL722_12783 [Aureococcus anophagefferens]